MGKRLDALVRAVFPFLFKRPINPDLLSVMGQLGIESGNFGLQAFRLESHARQRPGNLAVQVVANEPAQHHTDHGPVAYGNEAMKAEACMQGDERRTEETAENVYVQPAPQMSETGEKTPTLSGRVGQKKQEQRRARSREVGRGAENRCRVDCQDSLDEVSAASRRVFDDEVVTRGNSSGLEVDGRATRSRDCVGILRNRRTC